MKKSVLNLKGAQELSKKEQKEINGGALPFCLRQVNCSLPACMKYWTVEACLGTPID